MPRILAIILTLVLTCLVVTSLHAGPPLICHQIDIGNARSLPWGKDTFDKGTSYDVHQLPGDTLAILTPEAPIMVRMETLRRAAMHAGKNREIANALQGKLMARIVNAEAAAKPDALAYFDAGYLAGCYDQCGVEADFGPSSRRGDGRGAAGYAWLTHAITLAGESGTAPQMHLAAALMIVDSGNRAAQKEHLRAALLGGAGKDSKAELGLLEWIATIHGTTLDSLRTQLGLAAADGDR